MSFRLVDSGWDRELAAALAADNGDVCIVCPFIKKGALARLLKAGQPRELRVVTRFNLSDFAEGVSDLSALRLLLHSGAKVRGVRNLRAKLYLFGTGRAIVTSANLTDAALLRNHEFGFVADDAKIVGRCNQYFDGLWGQAGKNFSAAQLTDWEHRIAKHQANNRRPRPSHGLGDEGVDAELFSGEIAFSISDIITRQAFVKFFGESHNRADRAMPILEEVERSGCHFACTYPKRPRQVQDKALIFMGRLVKEPNDILVYGRAVGMRHEPGRDDATDDDLRLRPWKKDWPHYVRVQHAEFAAGSLENGVSLNELMGALKSDSFMPTQRNAAKGTGNTDPRKAYMQQAAVELSLQGDAWLNRHLERVFAQHGRLTSAEMERLDWPVIPAKAKKVGG